MMQCALADILDNLHKGASAAQGSITIDGKKHQGNSILKCWFMLSNLGHTRNTYGDEKSLHLFLKKRPGLQSVLLNPIKDIELNAWCRDVLDNFHYHKFHYVLAAYRIYKELPRKILVQEELAKYLGLLVLPMTKVKGVSNLSKLEQLRDLFRKIRDISIVSLDGHYSHSPISIDLMSALVSFDSIEGGVSGQKISSVLNPIRNHLHENVYLDKNVLALQRAYEVSALGYLTKLPQNASSYSDLLDKSIKEGIVDSSKLKLTHFCRFKISKEMQSDSDFYDEFRNLTVKSRVGCKNTQAYLDVNPFTRARYADFFIDSDFDNSQLPSFIYNICDLVKGQVKHLVSNRRKEYKDIFSRFRNVSIENGIESSLIDSIIEESKQVVYLKAFEPANKLVFPSYRSLMLSCISYFLKDNYRLEIEEKNASYEDYAFKVPEHLDEFFIERIDSAISEESKIDMDRVHELEMIKKSASRKFDGYKVACLVRVNITDLTKPPSSRKVTDLDGVLLKVSKEAMVLEIFEAKNKRSAGSLAKKDLKEKLTPALSKNATGYRISEVNGFGAKMVIRFGR